jgi:hypothetical protein
MILMFLVELLTFHFVCLLIALPLALALIYYDEAGGGPLGRAKARAERKAKRDYLRSLSPEARQAFRRLERRQREFARLDMWQPYKVGSWDDVIEFNRTGRWSP